MSRIVKEADVAVIGSGPGGATVARQMARAGKKVVLLEWGRDWRNSPFYGTHTGCLMYTDKMGMLLTKERLNIVRGIMTGGSSNLFCGTASRPPAWLRDKYGVNIDAEVSETIDELKIGPLPDKYIGDASKHVLDAALSLGLDWEPYPKFMNPDKCNGGFKCGSVCMLGCSCGAKWTANEYIDQAVLAGCELITGVRVRRVIHDGTNAHRVEGRLYGMTPIEVRARVVVLCASGIGSPRILQQSGFMKAGQGMLMDPTVMVYGAYDGPGTYADPQMSVGSYDDSNGYILSHLMDPWLLYPMIMMLKGPGYALTFPRYKRTLGIMIKVKDEVAGGVFPDGSISKPMTVRDKERLRHAENVCHKILIRAGCNPRTIFTTPLRGTHPSGTVRIGEMLDSNLKLHELNNMYVCDASTFPEALDRPIVLTVIGMGKRLAAHLLKTHFA